MVGLAAPGEVVRVGVDKAPPGQGLRLAELLTAVSLATDLAHDVAAESALRDAVLAVELARFMGWPAPEVSDAYYLALLYHIGCTGAVALQSRLGGGDDVTVRRWMSEADFTDRPELVRIAMLLDRAGIDPQASTAAQEILRTRLAEAARELIALFAAEVGEAFVASHGQDLGAAFDALRAIGPDAVRLIFAQEMERALVEVMRDGGRAIRRRHAHDRGSGRHRGR